MKIGNYIEVSDKTLTVCEANEQLSNLNWGSGLRLDDDNDVIVNAVCLTKQNILDLAEIVRRLP